MGLAALALFSFAVAPAISTGTAQARPMWTPAQAESWHKANGNQWLRGSNFLPSSAINQIEMWASESFDEPTIDRELGYAQSLGFNSMRVFLHDLSYQQDPAGFLKRVDRFLTIAEKHKIRPLFVFFDSCWYPLPYLGAQMAPRPYTHNSGWVQSPGVAALQAPGEYPRLRTYVTNVVKRFANDNRIAGWDVWNEPDNFDGGAVARPNLEPKNKVDLVNALLPQVFAWARDSNPTQPLTSGVWKGNWSEDAKLSATDRIQLENSDVISFHNYGDDGSLKRCIDSLRRYNRPVICTEYMARPNKSVFNPNLGLTKAENVGAYNWGFVSGKSQTIYPWDSWTKNYTSEPPVWFHDILRMDGSAYIPEEVQYIRRTTGAAN
ncbi:1,4-beta-xylanase [bacterium]|nr:MAG: 1,4-beta-xylanase [bacterium]